MDILHAIEVIKYGYIISTSPVTIATPSGRFLPYLKNPKPMRLINIPQNIIHGSIMKLLTVR